MKIAITGKGGAGKTTAVTLLASYLARESRVLAFDVDTNENLASSLGFSERDIRILDKIRNHTDEIFEYTKTEQNWKKRKYTPNKDANYYEFGNKKISKFIQSITLNRGNVYVGHLGNVDEEKRGVESMCDSFTLMRIFLNHLKVSDDSFLLVDLAAGNDLITRSTIINLDTVLLVVEPTQKNISVAKDILISLNKISFEKVTILLNKSFKEEDIILVSKNLKIDVKNIIRIPFSQEILDLDNKNNLKFENISRDFQDQIIKLVDILRSNVKTVDLDKITKNLDERVKMYEV